MSDLPPNIEIKQWTGQADRTGPAGQTPAETVQTLLRQALAPSLRDDRFDGWSPPPGLIAAVGYRGDEPIGFLGGTVDRDRLQLDALLVASTNQDQHDDQGEQTDPAQLLDTLYTSLEPAMNQSEATVVELWGKPAKLWHETIAAERGFEELRALHQLRCVLPVDTPSLETRGFVIGQDEQALLRVNNRAFASHPDQGNMTIDDLHHASAQPWFDPEGIRLFDDPDAPGHLAGFCWTKVHEPLAPGEPKLGEIYAIGIDPDHHGKGLGTPMTAAGLTYMADQGLTTGMLYVEADNAPALRTYEKLGFTHHRTDRAWHKPLATGPESN